jgi:hypothetical protein
MEAPRERKERRLKRITSVRLNSDQGALQMLKEVAFRPRRKRNESYSPKRKVLCKLVVNVNLLSYTQLLQ